MLTVIEKKRPLTQAAQASKSIKKMLAGKYQNIKFKVTSKNYAGGNSVDISWNLGPVDEDIEKLVSKYQYGHFDGMIDCYEYSNTRNDIPQSKFVFAQREYRSEEELANYKLPYKEQKDLYREGKTLRNDIARQICTLVEIAYYGIDSQVPDVYKVCYRTHGGEWMTWNDLVYRLLAQTNFDSDKWEGYKVDFDYENDQKITNKFRIIKV